MLLLSVQFCQLAQISVVLDGAVSPLGKFFVHAVIALCVAVVVVVFVVFSALLATRRDSNLAVAECAHETV